MNLASVVARCLARRENTGGGHTVMPTKDGDVRVEIDEIE
jgi:hypothetical protein